MLKGRITLALVAAMIGAVAVATTARVASAASIQVTNTNDSGPGSLRAAIASANSGDTITFASSLDGQTITLTSGALDITKGLTIDGPGATELTISGNDASRVFSIPGGGSSGASVTISGLTITQGSVTSGNGGAMDAELNASLGTNSLTLINDAITDSHSTDTSFGAGGGGIQAFLTSSDSLTITNSVVSGNGARNGGGLQDYGPGPVTISNSTFSNNTASIGSSLGSGGGLFLQGPATITNSTFSNNSAATGGGAYIQASAASTVTGSTFSGNMATEANPSGGGMFVQSGQVNITNSTFTGNSADTTGGGSGYGGGIFRCCGAPPVSLVNDTIDANSVTGSGSTGGDVASDNGSPTVSARNTIIADGTSATPGFQNCGEFETSLGHNLSSGNCGFNQAGDLINTEPQLGSLADNGGPTETMAESAGSPAIDAGDVVANCPTADQRGASRPDNGEPTCDIGSYEYQDPAATSVPYHPLTPARICDTRPAQPGVAANQCNDNGAGAGTLGPGGTLSFQAEGQGGVPASGVSAVVLNVTVTGTTQPSFLTVWPDGTARPNASNLNWSPGETTPNAVEVPVGSDGKVAMYNHAGSADVVVDVSGYTAANNPGTGLYEPLSPGRICDTRPVQSGVAANQCNHNGTGAGTLGAGQTLNVTAGGVGGVPSSGVSAVVLNVTVTDTTAASFLTVWPTGASQPNASSLNWSPGETVPNRVIVPVGSNGQVSFFNHAGATDVVVDVGGWFTDGSNPAATGVTYTALSPTRICDTRGVQAGVTTNQCNHNGSSPGTLGPSGTVPIQVTGLASVPADASAVVANVTVTDTTAPSFLTVWPDGTTQPTASDLNWVAGVTVPNLVVVKLGGDGRVDAFNHAGSTDVVVDVEGYYS